MKDIQEKLINRILLVLSAHDEKGNIVLVENSTDLTQELTNEIKSIYSGELFSPQELFLFSQLASECANNSAVFQGELQSVTGFKPQELSLLAKKLKELSGQ